MGLFTASRSGFPVYFTPPQSAYQQPAESRSSGMGTTDKDVKEKYNVGIPKGLQLQSDEYVEQLKGLEALEANTMNQMFKLAKDNSFNQSKMLKNGDFEKLFAMKLALKRQQIDIANIYNQVEANKAEWTSRVGATQGNKALGDYAQDQDGKFYVINNETGMLAPETIPLEYITSEKNKRVNSDGTSYEVFSPLPYGALYNEIGKQTHLFSKDGRVQIPDIPVGESLMKNGNPLFIQKLIEERDKINEVKTSTTNDRLLTPNEIRAMGIDPQLYAMSDIMATTVHDKRFNTEQWDGLMTQIRTRGFSNSTYFTSDEMKSAQQEYLRAREKKANFIAVPVVSDDGKLQKDEKGNTKYELKELGFGEWLQERVSDVMAGKPRVSEDLYGTTYKRGPTWSDGAGGSGTMNFFNQQISAAAEGLLPPNDAYQTAAVPTVYRGNVKGEIPFALQSVPVAEYSISGAGPMLNKVFDIKAVNYDGDGKINTAGLKTVGDVLGDNVAVMSYGDKVLLPLKSENLSGAYVLGWGNNLLRAPNVIINQDGKAQIDTYAEPTKENNPYKIKIEGSKAVLDYGSYNDRKPETYVNQSGEIYAVLNIAVKDSEFKKLGYEYKRMYDTKNTRALPGQSYDYGSFYGSTKDYESGYPSPVAMKNFYGITKAYDSDIEEVSGSYPSRRKTQYYVVPILVKMNEGMIAEHTEGGSKVNPAQLAAMRANLSKLKSMQAMNTQDMNDPMNFVNKEGKKQGYPTVNIQGKNYSKYPDFNMPVEVEQEVESVPMTNIKR